MSLELPTNYKTLGRYFFEIPYRNIFYFTCPLRTFKGTLFEPYIRKAKHQYEVECPECGLMGCRVRDNEFDPNDFFIHCENCGLVDLTPDDVELCKLEVDPLVEALAQLHGWEAERIERFWSFGKVLIAGKYRSVYFSPHPSEEEVDTLLQTSGSILLTFNVRPAYKAKYPYQVFTMAELQQDPKSLVVNLQMIADEVADKPKEKRSARKDERAIQEKKLIALLDQEIRHYQQCLLPGNKPLLDAYKHPTCRRLAERMTLEGVKITYSTISRLLKNSESLELKILYNILQQPEQVKLYKGLAHARAVLSVNR